MLATRLGWTCVLLALLSGCFLNAGPISSSDENGGGGSAGATTSSTGAAGSTSSAGGGTSSSSTTSGTGGMPPTECTHVKDCDDKNECTTESCVNNQCAYATANEGAVIEDADPFDCKKTICTAGQAVDVQASDQLPADTDECTLPKCNGTKLEYENDNEGGLCGVQPTDLCQKRVCDKGSCSLVTLPDGTVVVDGGDEIPADGGDCRDTACVGGVSVLKSNFLNCEDPGPGNCAVPKCDSAGICKVGAGNAQAAPAGFPCDTNNDGSLDGKCDGSGTGVGNCKP